MGIFKSTRTLKSFFDDKEFQRYQKLREDPQAQLVYKWLQMRIDMLMASVINHQRPALQGVIRELELYLMNEFGWTARMRSKKANEQERRKVEFFVTMIGAMTKHILLEYKFERGRKGVPLRHKETQGLIRTASEYRYDKDLDGKDPFLISAAAIPKGTTKRGRKKK